MPAEHAAAQRQAAEFHFDYGTSTTPTVDAPAVTTEPTFELPEQLRTLPCATGVVVTLREYERMAKTAQLFHAKGAEV